MSVTPHGLKGKPSNFANKGKDTCPRGHKYDEKNTYWWNGRRICRMCRKLYYKLKTNPKEFDTGPRLVYDGEL